MPHHAILPRHDIPRTLPHHVYEVAEAKATKASAQLETICDELEVERAAHKATKLELDRVCKAADVKLQELSAARHSSQRMQELRDKFQGNLEQALATIEQLEKELNQSQRSEEMLQIHICDEYVPAQQQLAQTLKDMQALNLAHKHQLVAVEHAHATEVSQLKGELASVRASLAEAAQARDTYHSALQELRGQVFQDQEDEAKAQNSMEAQLVAARVEAARTKSRNEDLEQKFTELKLALWAVTEPVTEGSDELEASSALLGLHRRVGRILDVQFPATSHLASPPSPPSPRHIAAMRRVHDPARFNNQESARGLS